MRRPRFLLLPLILLLIPGAQALSQTVRGKVLESGSETPIILAEVVLLDTAMAVVDQTFSAHDGAFILQSPRPGSFYVRAGAMGYLTKVDGIVDLGDGGILPILFFLVPDPVIMEGFEVTAERERMEESLEIQGFYERKAEGGGYFITPEEIEKREIRNFQQLFQRSSIEVSGGLTHTILRVRGRCPETVLPQVYVDGALVDLRWDRAVAWWDDPQQRGGLEEVVRVSDILAVEIYAGSASTPLQWSGTRLNRSCGTIVIWTKGGG